MLAVEISRQAIETLQGNIETNGFAGKVVPVHADGFSHPAIEKRAPFDLIVMNILPSRC